MVDAISFSTTAAARQNDINVRATVVATTTLVMLAFWESVEVCMALAVRFGSRQSCFELVESSRIEEDHVVPVSPQHAGERLLSLAPPPFAASDHDNRLRQECLPDSFVTVAAEIHMYRRLQLPVANES